MTQNWHPTWWNETHGNAWERAKEAIHRDWEQTKHDLSLPGGHELNQSAGDTLKQVTGSDEIPGGDRPNPAKVIGSWDDVELPVGYGFGARQQYGREHPEWNAKVEKTLQSEWERGKVEMGRAWEDVKRWVRHGYDSPIRP